VQPRPGHSLKHYYVGLAAKPPTGGGINGTEFALRGARLGTISVNSLVFYRDPRVGEVQQTMLEPDNRHFRITVFIDAPFDHLVHDGTRFWNASAVQVSTTAAGPRLQFQSVPALFSGAVDFTTPDHAGEPAKVDAVFHLYESRDAAQHAPDARAMTYRVTFQAGEARGPRRRQPASSTVRCRRSRPVRRPASPASSRRSMPRQQSWNAMPIDQIAADVHQATQHIAALRTSPQLQNTLRNLDETMANVTQVTQQARAQVGPIMAELRASRVRRSLRSQAFARWSMRMN